jgi:EAL domain-containing protein (putative c-di-GMP-specific phosphodiesterase class I)
MGAAPAVALVVTQLVAAYAIVRLRGGAPDVLMHAFYLPIIYASVRFGRRGGWVTALAAGSLAGPLTPLAVDGSPQPMSQWAIRLGFFVAVSAGVSWLARQDARPLDVMLGDVRWMFRIRDALRRGALTAHYQPIADLRSGAQIGVEALCRWPDGRGGFHSPGEFIPAAERSGVIAALDRYMVAAVTAQAASWAGDSATPPLVTVNVSAAELTDRDFIDHLAQLCADLDLDPTLLCLEITETAIVANRDRARDALTAARRLGATIALDDFGTGESSLAFLRTFPIDIIKIDQSFVSAIEHDTTARDLVAAILAMARVLGAATIAEGIETSGQLDALRDLGCDMGQGWLLGRPAPPTSPWAGAASDPTVRVPRPR